MKRILIFSLAYYPNYIGGAEVAIKEITNRIPASDYEFHMVTLRFDFNLPKEEKIGNVMVHRIGFVKINATIMDLGKFPLFLNKYLLPITGFIKAWQLNKIYKFDLVWNIMANHAAFAGLFFKLTHPKVRYLLTLQEGDPIEYIRGRVRLVYPIFKKIFTKADFIQTISTYLAHWARSEGYDKENLLVVPNGVDTANFFKEILGETLIQIKNKIGKRSNEEWLIHTGRLVKKNGLDFVIRALPLLPSSVHFFMIGDGTDRDNLERLATDNGVLSRVHFHSYVPNGELPLYLKSCDIFIRPSLSEGFGISFIEAMAAGVPVIATQEGGIADFLFDPERNSDKEPTGLAVNPRDPEGIARAVRRYIDDPVLKARIVENGKKLAFLKYDWDLIARDMKERVFDRLFSP